MPKEFLNKDEKHKMIKHRTIEPKSFETKIEPGTQYAQLMVIKEQNQNEKLKEANNSTISNKK